MSETTRLFENEISLAFSLVLSEATGVAEERWICYGQIKCKQSEAPSPL